MLTKKIIKCLNTINVYSNRNRNSLLCIRSIQICLGLYEIKMAKTDVYKLNNFCVAHWWSIWETRDRPSRARSTENIKRHIYTPRHTIWTFIEQSITKLLRSSVQKVLAITRNRWQNNNSVLPLLRDKKKKNLHKIVFVKHEITQTAPRFELTISYMLMLWKITTFAISAEFGQFPVADLTDTTTCIPKELSFEPTTKSLWPYIPKF